MKIAFELNPIWRIDVDHLHLARQRLALAQARHHLQGVTEDETVGPLDVVAVELDRLGPVFLRFGEEFALDVLAPGSAEDSLGTHPLVDGEGDGVDLKVALLLGLALACLLEPGLVVAQGFFKKLLLLGRQGLAAGFVDQREDAVGLARWVVPEDRREVGIVPVLLFQSHGHRSLAGGAARGEAEALVVVVGEGLGAGVAVG